ncbi:MAG: amidohydrolase, partial [Chloroflexi bacterium]|nr:amidohydrolase [Chloroflexota bacterium]
VIRSKAEATPTDRWIRGFGYDHLAFPEKRHPSRWDLDRAAPHHPVRLDHRSGHATVLNSRALGMAGIDKATPDPIEGVIERQDGTGEPTGLLLEMSGFLRQRLGASADRGEFEQGVSLLNQKLLSYGITSVQDAGPDNDLARWETFRELKNAGSLGCRVTMMAGAAHLNEFLSQGMAWGSGDNWLRLGHVKIMLTLTTGQLQPTYELLKETVEQAHQAGFPVAIHAVEQEAVAAAAQALEEIPPIPLYKWGQGGISPAKSRDRIEHCAECPPDLVARVRAARATVVTQPGFVYWNGDGYLQRVETSLLPHLYPVGALHRAGVPVAFGSDAPVIDPNPWPAIYSAVTRTTRAGKPIRPLEKGPETKREISVGTALRMYTSAGAYAEGTEKHKGTIQPGKLADLVLLDNDPTTCDPEKLKDIRAVLTVVGGQVAWGNGLYEDRRG